MFKHKNELRQGIFGAALLLAAGTRSVSAAPSGAKPNVLFIAVDDLNDFPLFMQRYPDAVTPNMDQLAKRGMVFSNAHCQFPICGPSRDSVMSGLFPSTLGSGQNKVSDEELEKKVQEMGTELLHT